MNPVGLLLVDKPEGPTSHDVVDWARRRLGLRRIGHTGTLDPFASGLLVLCVGWATRLAEFLSPLPKLYRGTIRLGERTDTDDRTGRVVASSEGWRNLSLRDIEVALASQVGTIEQRPPVYSAKKVAGRRAHEVARAGGRAAVRPERVTIKRLSVCDISLPDVCVEIECSSGTYVRGVARDVGASLAVGGHLSRLRRLRVGSFRVQDAVNELSEELPAGELKRRLRPAAEAVSHLGRADLPADAGRRLRHGQPVRWSEKGAEPIAVFVDDELVAVAETKEGQLWPKKVLAQSD